MLTVALWRALAWRLCVLLLVLGSCASASFPPPEAVLQAAARVVDGDAPLFGSATRLLVTSTLDVVGELADGAARLMCAGPRGLVPRAVDAAAADSTHVAVLAGGGIWLVDPRTCEWTNCSAAQPAAALWALERVWAVLLRSGRLMTLGARCAPRAVDAPPWPLQRAVATWHQDGALTVIDAHMKLARFDWAARHWAALALSGGAQPQRCDNATTEGSSAELLRLHCDHGESWLFFSHIARWVRRPRLAHRTPGAPISCEAGDLDGNGVVNALDLLQLLAMYGPCPPAPATCRGDLNHDGVVDQSDEQLLTLVAMCTYTTTSTTTSTVTPFATTTTVTTTTTTTSSSTSTSTPTTTTDVVTTTTTTPPPTTSSSVSTTLTTTATVSTTLTTTAGTTTTTGSETLGPSLPPAQTNSTAVEVFANKDYIYAATGIGVLTLALVTGILIAVGKLCKRAQQ